MQRGPVCLVNLRNCVSYFSLRNDIVQTQAILYDLNIVYFPCSQILIFLIGMYNLNSSNVIPVLTYLFMNT